MFTFQPRCIYLAMHGAGCHESYCATLHLFLGVTAQSFYYRIQDWIYLPNLLSDTIPFFFFKNLKTQEGICTHATIIF